MTSAVERRYTPLAKQAGSLSCGRPLAHAAVQPGQVCLDLGCGRGADALALAAAVGPTGRVVGLDATPGMVVAAQEAARAAGTEQVTFVEGRFEQLPLPDASVDWVTSNCALNHSADQRTVWREIARVLKPGGGFSVGDIVALEPIAARWRTDPAAVAECWAGAPTMEELNAHLVAAGLAETKVVERSEPYVRGVARLSSITVVGRKPVGRAAAMRCAALTGKEKTK